MAKLIPILFSTPMVQAILEGRKTMTRRVCCDNGEDVEGFTYVENNPTFPETWKGKKAQPYTGWVVKYKNLALHLPRKCPYGKVGDILWVRETWQPIEHPEVKYRYKADHKNAKDVIWKPSIFMPKEACRLFLQVESVKVERLHDISVEDAIAEGIKPVQSFNSGEGIPRRQLYENYCDHGYTEVLPKDSFMSLWFKINGEESWNANPFVWCISFKKIDKPA